MGNKSSKRATTENETQLVCEPKVYQPDLDSISTHFNKQPSTNLRPFSRPDGLQQRDSHLRLNYGTATTTTSNLSPSVLVNGIQSQQSLVLHRDRHSSFPLATKTLISRQSCSSSITNYDPFATQRTYRPLGIGSKPIVPVCNAIESQPPEKVVEIPTSYKIWEDSYLKHKIQPDALEYYSSRIGMNADIYQKSNDYKAHSIRLDRIKETSRLFSGKESKKPECSINSWFDISDRLQSWKKYDTLFFSPKPKRPELTSEMLEEIHQASKPHPNNEVLVELEGVQILRKDIYTLTGLNWLNDEIVNAYLNLLVIRGNKQGYKKVYTFNTFFYPKLRESGYSSIRRWTRRVDIFIYDYVLVPVHLGNHWCLASIDFSQKMISYYDSLGGNPNGCCDTLLDYLREESNDKKKQDFDDENWRLVDRYQDGIPQQKNCSDCGVFACTYAEYLTRKAKLDFTQEHMPYFRKKMIYEIIKKEILE